MTTLLASVRIHNNAAKTAIFSSFVVIQQILFICFLMLSLPILMFGNQPIGGKKASKKKTKNAYKSSISNRVWLDLNRDGIQDEFEEGLNDFTVILYCVDTHQVFSTKTRYDKDTGEAGFYQFNNLPSGEYRVIFEIPQGYEASPKDVDNNKNDKLDSDADPLSGATDVFSLKNGKKDIRWSIGLCLPTLANVE